MSDSSNTTTPFIDEPTGELLEQFPLGICLFSAGLVPYYINRNFYRFGAFTEDDVPGNVPLTESTRLISVLGKQELLGVPDGGFIEKEVSVATGAAGSISLLIKAVPIFGTSGPTGGMVLIEDIKRNSEASAQTPTSGTNMLQAEHTLHDVLSSAFALFLLLDEDAKIVSGGGILLELLTRDSSAIVGLSVHSVLPREIMEEVNRLFLETKIKKERQSAILSVPVSTKDTPDFECLIAPLQSSSENSTRYILVFREASANREKFERMEKEVEELKRELTIHEAGNEVVIALDDKARISFWTNAGVTLFGRKRSEVFGKPVNRVIPLLTNEILQEVKNEKTSRSTVTEIIDSENRRKTCSITLSYNPLEEPYCWLVLVSDVTSENKRERELKKLVDLYSAFAANSHDMMVLVDEDWNILFANEMFLSRAKERFGEDEFRFNQLFTAAFHEQMDMTPAAFHAVASEPIELPIEFTFGHPSTILMMCSQHDAGDSSELYLMVFYDITRQKQMEGELQMLKAVFQNSGDGIAVELGGHFLFANEAFATLYGYNSSAELAGVETLRTVDENEQSKAAGGIGRKTANARFEFLSRRKDGSRFYAELVITPFELLEKEFSVIIARDVTERKRIQQVTKESEERYRSITENLDDFFWIAERVNDTLKPIFYTFATEKITGYASSDFLMDEKLFFRILYPDDFENYKTRLKNFFRNTYKKSDAIEVRIIHKQGSVVWIRSKLTVIRDKTGTVQKIFGLVSDISAQKKAEEELRVTTNELKKLNDTKDRFISIVSHDLRTPFSSILGFTDLLLGEDDLNTDESRQYIQYIQESSRSMLQLVNSLLDWTRLQTGRIRFEPKKTDLSILVQKSVDALFGVAKQKGLNFVNALPSELHLFLDETLISQAINNLLSNALKFTPRGGSITIAAYEANLPRFIEISVRDTGQGINKDNLGKIFNVESKFSTDGTEGEKGTGLGLTLVKEIIEKHGGTIRVESIPGSGADFRFLLPKASATILLADDSNTDRILYAKILRGFVPDFEIAMVQNGKEAIEFLQRSAPALIISDHNMPVMNGYELVRAYNYLPTKGKPPIIILSGDIGKSEILAYKDLGVEYVFRKPVNLASFKEAVEQSLRKMPE